MQNISINNAILSEKLTLRPNSNCRVNLDYEKVEIQYMYFISQKIAKEIKGKPPFYSTESLNLFIERLKNKEITSDKYELRNENCQTILFHKRSRRVKIVLSAEQCFDVIVQAHIQTDHGDVRAIKMKTRKYSVPLLSIRTLLKSCNVCAQDETSLYSENQNDNIWTISIFNVQLYNNEFPFLLFYVETNSNYILIRPLKTNKEEEISLELFKIFMTFGPPVTILVSKKLEKIITKVQTIISSVHPDCMFKLQLCQIKNMLLPKLFRKVMKQNTISYTAIGYLKAQFILNNMLHSKPQDIFFRKTLEPHSIDTR